MKQNSKQTNSILVIGGGVGPAAGVDLHRLIIENSSFAVIDQDHLRVIHLSFSDLIADRTHSLKNNTYDIVANNMAIVIKSIIPTLTLFNSHAVVGIPCNTFHANPIFNQFISAMKPHSQIITIINMIKETVNYITSTITQHGNIGMMSTTGTRDALLYDAPLNDKGFHVMHCDNQDLIHSSIYHKVWGIKAVNGESIENKRVLTDGLEELYQKGAQAIILACTEIPLVIKESHYKGIPLINPVVLLAKAMIESSRNN